MMGREDKARGETLGKKKDIFWRALFSEEDCITGFWLGDFCWLGGLYYWFFLEELVGGLLQGAPIAGNFGLRGQETVRNPGAREPDRLFLAGWEVSQFWAELQAELENNNSISWRYVFSLLCCVMWSIIMLLNMLNMWFIIMLLINLISVEHGYMLNNEWLYMNNEL
jgi:hypothetical protein